MSNSTERERLHRIAVARARECAELCAAPAPGTAAAIKDAEDGARQLGKRHWFAELELQLEHRHDSPAPYSEVMSREQAEPSGLGLPSLGATRNEDSMSERDTAVTVGAGVNRGR